MNVVQPFALDEIRAVNALLLYIGSIYLTPVEPGNEKK
jgi:hypothetical protein